MKRFETPILNIENFDLENIVTESGTVEPAKQDAVEAATAKLGEYNITTENIFTISL